MFMPIICIFLIICFIAGIFFAIYLTESAIPGITLPNIEGYPSNMPKESQYKQLKHDLPFMEFVDDDGSICKLNNISEKDYKLYYAKNKINDIKENSVLLIKRNAELNITFDKIPECAFIINPVQPYCIDTVLNKVWNTINLESSHISPPEITNRLTEVAYSILEHPKFQEIRQSAKYPGDAEVINDFVYEIRKYIKQYFTGNNSIVNKYDRMLYITTNISDKENYYLRIYTATNYVGKAIYQFTYEK